MYGGHDEEVTLECGNGIIGVILDRFGTETIVMPVGRERFRVRVPVVVSRQFFGWVTGIGANLHIAGPEHVRQEYKEYLQSIVGRY